MVALVFLAAIFLAVVLVAISGFAVSVLWGWFAVPFGVAPISVAHAVGIVMLVSLITGNYAKTMDVDDETPDSVKVFVKFAAPFLAILLGWIIQKFM